MKVTRIDYGNYILRLRVLRPDAEVTTTPASSIYNGRAFWDDFMALGRKVKAPPRTPDAEDFRHANRLLKQHGKVRLLEFARLFWSRYSSPVFERPETHVMRLFAARIPDIIREI